MTYIAVRPDGMLVTHDARPTPALIRAEVGYFDRVRIRHPHWDIVGWVPETGHVDGSPRNVVGSVMLITLGAFPGPYAGTVLITGWDPPPGAEVVSLGALEADYIKTLHGCVSAVVANDPMPGCAICTPVWREAAAQAAELVRTAPTPTIEIITDFGGSGN